MIVSGGSITTRTPDEEAAGAGAYRAAAARAARCFATAICRAPRVEGDAICGPATGDDVVHEARLVAELRFTSSEGCQPRAGRGRRPRPRCDDRPGEEEGDECEREGVEPAGVTSHRPRRRPRLRESRRHRGARAERRRSPAGAGRSRAAAAVLSVPRRRVRLGGGLGIGGSAGGVFASAFRSDASNRSSCLRARAASCRSWPSCAAPSDTVWVTAKCPSTAAPASDATIVTFSLLIPSSLFERVDRRTTRVSGGSSAARLQQTQRKGSVNPPMPPRVRGDDAGMRILVVEDEDAIAEPLVDGLRREGYEVDRAATGAAALDGAPAGPRAARSAAARYRRARRVPCAARALGRADHRRHRPRRGGRIGWSASSSAPTTTSSSRSACAS